MSDDIHKALGALVGLLALLAVAYYWRDSFL